MSEERLEDVLADHGIALDLLPDPRVDRRGFITALGGGVAVLILFPRLDADAQRGGRGGAEGPTEIGGWVHIGEDGQVTAYVGKVELGQNARTSLSMVVAEELRRSRPGRQEACPAPARANRHRRRQPRVRPDGTFGTPGPDRPAAGDAMHQETNIPCGPRIESDTP